MQFGRLAGRSDRHIGVVHVLGDVLRLALGCHVNRDAVAGDVKLAGKERLVVRRVVPRRGTRNELTVERLDIFQRLHRLRRVDDDLVVLVDEVTAMGPQRPVQPGVGVARGVAERHAGRSAVLVETLAEFEEAGGVLREFLEARLLHRADAIVHQRAGAGDRNADPLAVLVLAVGIGGIRPAAVLLAEIVRDVRHIDALGRQQMRQRIKTPHHVEALPGVGRNRRLRLNVVVGFVGDVDFDAGGLGEGRDDVHESLVFGFHETLPAQEIDLGAGFRFPLRGLRPGRGEAHQLINRQSRSTCEHGGAALQKRAPIWRKITHNLSLPILPALDCLNRSLAMALL